MNEEASKAPLTGAPEVQPGDASTPQGGNSILVIPEVNQNSCSDSSTSPGLIFSFMQKITKGFLQTYQALRYFISSIISFPDLAPTSFMIHTFFILSSCRTVYLLYHLKPQSLVVFEFTWENLKKPGSQKMLVRMCRCLVFQWLSVGTFFHGAPILNQARYSKAGFAEKVSIYVLNALKFQCIVLQLVLATYATLVLTCTFVLQRPYSDFTSLMIYSSIPLTFLVFSLKALEVYKEDKMTEEGKRS